LCPSLSSRLCPNFEVWFLAMFSTRGLRKIDYVISRIQFGRIS
jgi:hypothetical protein